MKQFKKNKNEKEKVKEYILWVTTKHTDGGYSSHWYGWSQSLTLTYEEAINEKARIQDDFYAVEMNEI